MLHASWHSITPSALTVAGLDLGLIVGMAAGMLSFIPYVGIDHRRASPRWVLRWPNSRTGAGVAVVIGVLVIGQILEGYVIYPRFLGDRVELPAVWVIFALFAGGAAFGFVGVMLAVPMAATIGVLAGSGCVATWPARSISIRPASDSGLTSRSLASAG